MIPSGARECVLPGVPDHLPASWAVLLDQQTSQGRLRFLRSYLADFDKDTALLALHDSLGAIVVEPL